MNNQPFKSHCLELGAGGLDLWLPGFVFSPNRNQTNSNKNLGSNKKKWREISLIVVPDWYLIVLDF